MIIPNVGLVVNANVPPVGVELPPTRWARRIAGEAEAFAFATTFCRDLPWDQIAFDNPARFLSSAKIARAQGLARQPGLGRSVTCMPLCWVHFYAVQRDDFNIRTSIGAFFGSNRCRGMIPIAPNPPVEAFLAALRGDWADSPEISQDIGALTRGTVLDGRQRARILVTGRRRKPWRHS